MQKEGISIFYMKNASFHKLHWLCGLNRCVTALFPRPPLKFIYSKQGSNCC